MSSSALIEHYKDVLVLDLVDPLSINMFKCLPAG